MLQLNNLSHPAIQQKISIAINTARNKTLKNGVVSNVTVRNKNDKVLFVVRYCKEKGLTFIPCASYVSGFNNVIENFTSLVRSSMLKYANNDLVNFATMRN